MKNPILNELKQMRGADFVRPERYLEQILRYLRYVDDPQASSEDEIPWTTAERDYARKVLTRLVAVGSTPGRN